MYLVLASSFLEMILVAAADDGFVRHGVFVFSLGSTHVVFRYCVVISKIVLFLVHFVCFDTIPSVVC